MSLAQKIPRLLFVAGFLGLVEWGEDMASAPGN